MNQSEKYAENVLTNHGWKPKKINGRNNYSGYPDYKCNKGQVEVKMINAGLHIEINEDQIKKWNELLNDNENVFLFVVNRNINSYVFFEIKRGIL